MLRITRLSDYAIVVLGAAARGHDSVFTARSVAEETQLPLPAVKKILKSLGRHGLVDSLRGTAGGYRLGRAAAQIALADIIEAVEGPFSLTDCGHPLSDNTPNASSVSDSCEYQDHCAMQGNIRRVNGIVRRALASVTLADMIGPADRGLVPLRVKHSRASREINRSDSRSGFEQNKAL
jgi:FeS assembly SUF system regulator